MTEQDVFDADHRRFNDAFEKAGAVKTTDDGFAYIDTALVPAHLVSAYERLMQHGYANGLL